MNSSIKLAAGFIALAMVFAAPAHANENSATTKSPVAAKSAPTSTAVKSQSQTVPENDGDENVEDYKPADTAAAPVLAPAEVKKSAAAEKSAVKKQTANKTAPAAVVSANNDIVANLSANSNFKTLSNLIQAAGLADTLKGSGPYTIFAPTDAAFAKLPAGTLEDLLKPQNKASLRSILTYHVVPGKLTGADLSGKQLSQNTVEGSALTIASNNQGQTTIGSAKINGSEIVSSNGSIFTIDAVQLPSSYQPKSM